MALRSTREPNGGAQDFTPQMRTAEALRLAVRFRLALLMLAVGVVTLAGRGLQAAVDAGAYDRSLVQVLESRGLHADPGSVLWMHEPEGLVGLGAVFFLAARDGEPPDLYFGYARTVSYSAVLDVLFLSNLTRSSSAAEGRPLRIGSHVAFPVQLGDVYDAVVVLDLRGEPASLTADWSLLSKFQNYVSNIQETGRPQGFGVRRYPFVPAPESLSLEVVDGQFRMVADGELVRLSPQRDLPVEGEQRVQLRPQYKGRPGQITWLVDTVRRLPFVGSEPIEWLEHTVFGFTDKVSRLYHALIPVDVEQEVSQALPVPKPTEALRSLLKQARPELGLPPPPLKPLLRSRVRGEGQWLPLRDDPFLNQNPNAPPAFFQTFIRVDAKRAFSRVYITLWDPRQVDLRMAMGTREPESATGETGSGQIPRDPDVLRNLVGAFNGGFQAMHGEFGMMAEGRVYLPPKPFAATVAVYEDGRVGVGSWPGPGPNTWNEAFANAQIPKGMVALRQNLTSLVEGEELNPWSRWWWGAAPEWADEQTYLHRSGLCLTRDGFLAYFWGELLGPKELGQAMLAARCVRGMHLDMNSKHTGFEFLHPVPDSAAPAEQVAPVGRPLTDAEYEGPVRDVQGYTFRARKAVTTMTPLRFPRYLGTDPRDFFYLTLRPVLPGPDLRIGQRSISFRSEGLPHGSFPPAFAQAELLTTDGDGTRLLRIDPSRALPVHAGAAPAAVGGAKALTVAQLWRQGCRGCRGQATQGPSALYSVRERGRLRFAIGKPVADADVWLRARPLSAAGARAALGIDRDGFLVYAEASAQDARYLPHRLRRAGVERALALPGNTRLSLVGEEGWVGLDGAPVRVRGRRRPQPVLSFVADQRPRTQVLFPDVEPRPYREWGGLQDRRVRYFPEGPRRFRLPEAELSR